LPKILKVLWNINHGLCGPFLAGFHSPIVVLTHMSGKWKRADTVVRHFSLGSRWHTQLPPNVLT